MAMLKVTDLQVYYGVIQAIKGISFEVNEGEVIALIGANGAGKTTILHTITGLVEAKGGTVEFEGKNITKMPGHKIVTLGMAHVPEGRRVFSELTVLENLKMGAYTRKNKTEVEESLRMVYKRFPRLEERKNQLSGTLSGGEMKRLEIATVLAKPHKLCIFDEPEAGIDLWSFSMLIEQFEKMHKEKKQSLILISHQERIIQMADRIMVIEGGKIASIGQTADILPQLLGKTADSYSCLKCR